ncbi:MAG: hypothetical protein SVW02_02090 [Candidatus Nanohaloarchaea archaeon]|nr:hypothetical protein [Candidatus Nanohaloarchaea archaeon]
MADDSVTLEFSTTHALLLAFVVGVFAGGFIISAVNAVTGPTGAAVGPAGSTHEHAQFSVFVNGEEIDFSQPRYQFQQTQNSRVHFEAGDGSRIHKHATGVTIGFALESLDMGINATCLTVHDETYCEDGAATLETMVNGEEIQNPASHVIRDGERIRIEYTS